MSEPSTTWKARWRKCGFLPCAVLLASAVVICCIALLPIALWTEGLQGGFALGAAALICLGSGLAALTASSLQTPGQHAFHGLFVAMAFRLFPPLAVCLLLALRSNGLEHLGFVCYLLVFYMLTLSVETYLSVKRIRSQAC